MAGAVIGPKFYGWNKDGAPLAFGKLYTYEARTNVPKDTYQSEDQVVANDNPVILNGEGYANIYLDGSYKFILKDADDNEIWSADPVTNPNGEEWVNCKAATYLSAASFKITGNATDKYTVGRAVRIDNNVAEYAFSTIASAVFAAGETTITIEDAVVTTGIVGVCASISGQNSEAGSKKLINLSDIVNKSANVGDRLSTDERVAGTGYGGYDYEVTDVDPTYYLINPIRSDGTWLKLILKEPVSILMAGADPTGAVSSSLAVQETCLYARSLAQDKVFSGLNSLSRVSVTFPIGGNIWLDAAVSLALEAGRLDFECIGGKCNVFGDALKSVKGFVFDLMIQSTIKNLNFLGFSTIWEWDTNNTDATLVVFDNCDFLDSDVGVDTRSFAESRSTVMKFVNCRCNGVPLLADSFVDQLIFDGGSYKNGADDQALVKANSKVITIGGIWTPVFNGPDARWIDLYNDGAQGSRGLESHSTRFGPENGGIPIVYNYMEGDGIATSRVTDSICFYGGMPSSTDPTTKRSPVVLASNGAGASYAPNLIKFCGASWRGVGAVTTELGEPVLNLTQGEFIIDIDQASWSRLGNTVTNYADAVEDILELYLAPYARLNDQQTVTDTGTVELDASKGSVIYLNPGSAATVDSIINAFNGQEVQIIFGNNSATIEDFTTAGSRLFLQGKVDYSGSQFSTVSLVWYRAGNKWVETSRSVN